MPDKSVQTIRDLIYYQYAKVIARSAFKASDGKEAKKQHYGFIKKTLRELQSGVKLWSDITREDWQMIEKGMECAYCCAEAEKLEREHIVPRSLKIKPECSTCGHIQQIHNQVWSCYKCNDLKGTYGLYEFYERSHPQEKKFYDFIPPLLEKKYLKTIYNCHVCAGTLDKGDLDGDDEITVLDIDFILR